MEAASGIVNAIAASNVFVGKWPQLQTKTSELQTKVSYGINSRLFCTPKIKQQAIMTKIHSIYDMRAEREFSYAGLPVDEAIRHLVRFCANLWQIHAFCEGNTRTTAVFMIKYLRTLGFEVINDMFAQNSWYFRNALVRANYSNLQKGITETTIYLERFFRSMLLGEEYSFRNRELHIDWKEGETNDDVQSAKGAVQSANFALNLPLKCKSCTLEEIAVLRVVQTNPTATQNQMAATIGKSERTVKSITVSLQEKGILRRVGGKRDGRWEITDDKALI